MKVIRSSKCSLKFSTEHKKQELNKVLTEYGSICNTFINHFWNSNTPSKSRLLKDIVNIPETWLSARLRKVAAREAIDMIHAVRERWKHKPEKITMPIHRGQRMYVSCTIAELKEPETKEFDAWLHLQSIGKKLILDLPLKFHKHFHKWNKTGKRLNSYIITPDYAQFSFEVDTGPKRPGKQAIGIDTGINALASANTGNQFGLDVKALIERIKRCSHGSKGQKTARKALRQRIDEIVKEILNHFRGIDLIVVEKLKNLNYKTKLRRRLSRNIRRSIGSWGYRYWLKRLEQACEINCVSFRTVLPFYTSQKCPECGHPDRRNRSGTVFRCQSCDHSGNADVVGGRNILERFLTGLYGARYRPYGYSFDYK